MLVLTNTSATRLTLPLFYLKQLISAFYTVYSKQFNNIQNSTTITVTLESLRHASAINSRLFLPLVRSTTTSSVKSSFFIIVSSALYYYSNQNKTLSCSSTFLIAYLISASLINSYAMTSVIVYKQYYSRDALSPYDFLGIISPPLLPVYSVPSGLISVDRL